MKSTTSSLIALMEAEKEEGDSHYWNAAIDICIEIIRQHEAQREIQQSTCNESLQVANKLIDKTAIITVMGDASVSNDEGMQNRLGQVPYPVPSPTNLRSVDLAEAKGQEEVHTLESAPAKEHGVEVPDAASNNIIINERALEVASTVAFLEDDYSLARRVIETYLKAMGERANLVSAAGDAGRNQETGQHQAQHSDGNIGSPTLENLSSESINHDKISKTEILIDYTGIAHEIWATAQGNPGEGIVDAAHRIEQVLKREFPSDITDKEDDFDIESARKSLKPEAWKLLKEPIIQSLLYDINLLPEQITKSRHWYYMLAVISHMAEALATKLEYRPLWKLFNTAPLDGTPVMIWLNDEGFAVKASWRIPPKNEWEEKCWWCFEMDEALDPPMHNPTHWHPCLEGPIIQIEGQNT